MHNVVRRAGFPTKRFPSSCPTRQLSLKRTYTTGSRHSKQVPRRQYTTSLLVGTALLSATSGYLLATYESQKAGSTRETEEACASSLENPQYGTAKDFREAIEELKEIFPKPGAVSDEPDVLGPYGFSENDYHPGNPRLLVDTDSR
jgi:hypothetical protein